mmetsp:Transcript_26983/g.37542  ORF Transcript_26983/g.37542 Transcript_26983/m.37542 type:complete len:198 (-) Transcript_26983:103-696(-)
MRKIILGRGCGGTLKKDIQNAVRQNISMLSEDSKMQVTAQVGRTSVIYVPKSRLSEEPPKVVAEFIAVHAPPQNLLMLIYHHESHTKSHMRFKLFGLRLGASVLPVTGTPHVANLIKHLQRSKSISKLEISRENNLDDKIFEAVLNVPGVTETNVMSMLKKHKCIAGLANYYCSPAFVEPDSTYDAHRTRRINGFFK